MSKYKEDLVFAEKTRQKNKDWYANPENKKRMYLYNKSRREKNPERAKEESRKHHLRKKYNLTEEEFKQLLDSQENKCAICHTSDFGKKGPNIDHCHSTGLIRGILCSKCNKGLGLFQDNSKLLIQASLYLDIHAKNE